MRALQHHLNVCAAFAATVPKSDMHASASFPASESHVNQSDSSKQSLHQKSHVKTVHPLKVQDEVRDN